MKAGLAQEFDQTNGLDGEGAREDFVSWEFEQTWCKLVIGGDQL